ncbi:hypothetical protein KO465_10360 [Candidatus Micrarchaeota archaeon]|nr:hypothetical protein [Candidatus Micrarchaeota archaeon]
MKEPENCRFIFNDSVLGNKFLDDGQKKNGVIQEFEGRSPLCIMPIASSIDKKNRIVTIIIELARLLERDPLGKANIYFRFFIEPDINYLTIRKAGISRSTIIYDFKINEKRNLPQNSSISFRDKNLCKIHNCFFFNILPNSFDLSFFDNRALKNIRTLECDSFKRYLGDKRVRKNELVVVFYKKKSEESYSYFSIYSKERIGTGHFALAVLANLICGILLFIPNYDKIQNLSLFSRDLWMNLPYEVYFCMCVGLFILLYFTWPRLLAAFCWLDNILKSRS